MTIKTLAQVLAIDTNSPVEVRFMDGARLRGWIGEVSDTGFGYSAEELSAVSL